MVRSLLVLTLSLGMIGCGGPPSDQPPLVGVTGTVTLDGTPLSGASITFTPESGRRGASGQTNEQGQFELTYARSKGCPLGTHAVEISTRKRLLDEYGGEIGMEPERVPKRYNSSTELTAAVSADGENVFSFDLNSDGEIEEE